MGCFSGNFQAAISRYVPDAPVPALGHPDPIIPERQLECSAASLHGCFLNFGLRWFVAVGSEEMLRFGGRGVAATFFSCWQFRVLYFNPLFKQRCWILTLACLRRTWSPRRAPSLRPAVTRGPKLHFLHLNAGLVSVGCIWGGQRGGGVLGLLPAVWVPGCRRAAG